MNIKLTLLTSVLCVIALTSCTPSTETTTLPQRDEYHKVTVIYNGGTFRWGRTLDTESDEKATFSVKDGESIGETPNGERARYRLYGWEDEQGRKVTLNSLRITRDITVRAKWLFQSKVTFLTGMGSFMRGDTTCDVDTNTRRECIYEEGTEIKVPSEAPRRAFGYTFKGWCWVGKVLHEGDVAGGIDVTYRADWQEPDSFVVKDYKVETVNGRKVIRDNRVSDGQKPKPKFTTITYHLTVRGGVTQYRVYFQPNGGNFRYNKLVVAGDKLGAPTQRDIRINTGGLGGESKGVDVPKKSGYVWVGWTLNQVDVVNLDNYVVNKPVEVFPVWVPRPICYGAQ